MTYTLIQTVTLGSNSPNITLEPIPQDYDDLVVKLSVRSTQAAVRDNILFSPNGTSNSLNVRILYATGSAVAETNADGTSVLAYASGSSTTSNTFSNVTAYITGYKSSGEKMISVDGVFENNATEAWNYFFAAESTVSSALNSLTFSCQSGDMVAGSTVSVYGVKRLAAAPKATGGLIGYDATNNYFYHLFTASGTFTPSEDLSNVEYLVIAGGGGGIGGETGQYNGGGGGAGGYRSSVQGELSGGGAAAESPISLTSGTGYAITVGAGGAGIPIGSAGGSGSNSSFYGITSTGGGGGGGSTSPAPSGGSGGGGAARPSPATGGSGTAGQGFSGGDGGPWNGYYAGAGGGGAGAPGTGSLAAPPSSNPGFDGGDGVQSSITGEAIYRAGGGSGSAYPVSGGLGGGGTWDDGVGSGRYENGVIATGSGGSASRGSTNPGGSGGSGIVIVRYAA